MAGLSCAHALVEAGVCVTLFDKGRGAGGRMSTRRIESPLGEASFDFGAQYFTVRAESFRIQVEKWHAQGIVAPWPQLRGDAWVGLPGMNAMLRDMAAHHDVHFERLVRGLVREQTGWHVFGNDFQTSDFDAVILAMPAEQTAPILTLHDFHLAQSALFARAQPCWAGMFVFDSPIKSPSDVLRDRGIVAWAARENAKPGRVGPERWIVQANAPWSQANLEMDAESIGDSLLEALADVTGECLPCPVARSIHRWRYALSAGTGLGCLWNPDLRIGACGDWLVGPRVESAWLSGQHVARHVLATSGRSPAVVMRSNWTA